jgi:hypothetical protein
MLLPGNTAVQDADETDEATSRRRLVWIVGFVTLTVAASLSVYLFWRPPNRHFEPTPYDSLIGELRANMSEEDVLALFRSASEGNARAEVKAYDESSPGGSRRVISYRIGSDEPLKVLLGGASRRTAAEWCYRDHCHDDIE